jgi:hypothetical protein
MEFFMGLLIGAASGFALHATIVSRLEKAVADVKSEIARIESAVKAKL